MITCASNWLRKAYSDGLANPPNRIHGVVAAGGTGGTSLASAVMRDVLPIGLPKLIVSTAASGDTGAIVGESDITLMYSVCDIAGTNSLLRRILSNAAGSITGMAQAYAKGLVADTSPSTPTPPRKRVGLTMFGVTTPCVDRVREHLEREHNAECFVFHCTGHGGLALERLVEQGDLDAVLDITTTELCDHVAGGVMSAGPHRLEAAAKAGLPCVVSVGATDMVNFGPRATVPEKYRHRLLYEHNPTVTLMRTSEEECRRVGEMIAQNLATFAVRPERVVVVLPTGGVSAIATPGSPFYDAEADRALFAAVERGLSGTKIRVVVDDRDVNDATFAVDLANRLVALWSL
jgi:uncharacterized protein (UPF0261 family)